MGINFRIDLHAHRPPCLLAERGSQITNRIHHGTAKSLNPSPQSLAPRGGTSGVLVDIDAASRDEVPQVLYGTARTKGVNLSDENRHIKNATL